MLKQALDNLRSMNGISSAFVLNYELLPSWTLPRVWRGHTYWIRPLSLDWFIETEIFKLNTYRMKPIMPGDRILDVGAHIGLFSVYCGMLGASVDAFEPEIDNFNLLLKNTEGLEVYPFPVVASTHDGTVPFFFSRNKGNGSVHPYKIWKEVREVPCVDLERWLPCDVLKLDVEGSEYDLIEHLDLSKVEKEIVMECHLQPPLEGRLGSALRKIRSSGFKVDSLEMFQLNGYVHATR